MKSFIAFTKKEFSEQKRSCRLLFLGLVFVLFGIMNPAVAKLTPWLLETMAESLEQSGMLVTGVTVTAMDSWVQFFKNIPMALIAFILIESGIFTKEYSSGTLILSLTKGLSRLKVLISKTAILTSLWTVGYWLCFGITFIYNNLFWDNSVAKNLIFSAACYWVFGLFVVLLTVFFSVVAKANTAVLAGVGGVVFTFYIAGLIPKVAELLPTALTNGNALIYGSLAPKDYLASFIITITASILLFAASVPIFNKRTL